MRVIAANIRSPRESLGDLRALVAHWSPRTSWRPDASANWRNQSLGTDELIRYMDEPLVSELGFQCVVIPPHPRRAVGTRAADEEIELVNWKVSATATMPRVNRTPVAAPAQTAMPVREQAVRYVDAAATISTHHRDDRPVEQPIRGPAIVTEMDATTFVPPTFMATVDVSGNLHPVRRDASGENP